jgi:hypothetical protein
MANKLTREEVDEIAACFMIDMKYMEYTLPLSYEAIARLLKHIYEVGEYGTG